MQVRIKGANVCTIDLNDGTYLQSYKSIVAYQGRRGNILYPKWNYSRTTAKHVGQFFGLTSKEIKQRLKTGENNFYYIDNEPEL